jgi:hypothetical protein
MKREKASFVHDAREQKREVVWEGVGIGEWPQIYWSSQRVCNALSRAGLLMSLSLSRTLLLAYITYRAHPRAIEMTNERE